MKLNKPLLLWNAQYFIAFFHWVSLNLHKKYKLKDNNTLSLLQTFNKNVMTSDDIPSTNPHTPRKRFSPWAVVASMEFAMAQLVLLMHLNR